MSNRVLNVLNALKKRINEHQTLIQQTYGEVFNVQFTWNESASIEDVESICRTTGWVIPDDYKSFLLIHNGASLFSSEGSCFRLHPLSEIKEYFNDYHHNEDVLYKFAYPPEWYMIGTYHGFGEYAFIDSDRVTQGRTDYLIFVEEGSITRTKLNFEEWLDRFIVCQGEHFWNWN
ncbi:SMI1/KNR4 family protein [Brevibacillus agri]|uniref:SMI1/KNR4 family protein n=1 Tax=Brevibacillus agri TaxID=51101 RepID=UPI00287067DF|nr:SMI1/KNR4 family protein [Brevibacillus agri]MDR9507684.1 SMI1/KNR4 family protein [Brevibacillus agri]MED3501942.1 SMI1/KNR4 family protein [Brevibacillus agri]